MRRTEISTRWVSRINVVLLWLNRGLCVVACVLAVMIVAVAGERPAGRAATRAGIATMQHSAVPARIECALTVLSPELRDLRLYD